MTNNPKSRDQELVVQNLHNEVLIYDLTVNRAYTLNETSALIWHLCDGQTSVSKIAEQLSKQLKMPVGEEIVWLALDGFKKDNLLADSENVAIEFNGLSRRQVIRKVGLASLIALPVISSLVAPTAAHAASGTSARQDNGTTCTMRADFGGNTECKSGICLPTTAATYNPATGMNTSSPGGLKCCVETGAYITGSYYSGGNNISGNCNPRLCCTGAVSETLDAARNRLYCTCAATS